MKKTYLIGFILTLTVSLIIMIYFNMHNYRRNAGVDLKTYETGSKLLTVQDIVNALESPELHLKPQGEHDDYQGNNLNNVKPKEYEILDATLLIYEFDNSEALNIGLDGVKNIFPPHPKHEIKYKVYALNNILVVYLWSPSSTPNYLANEEIAKIEKGLLELINYRLKGPIEVLRENKPNLPLI